MWGVPWAAGAYFLISGDRSMSVVPGRARKMGRPEGDGMTFGIILYDEDRRIVAIDESAALVFQQPSRELLGRSLLDYVPRPDRAQMAEARATFERFGEASGQYALER